MLSIHNIISLLCSNSFAAGLKTFVDHMSMWLLGCFLVPTIHRFPQECVAQLRAASRGRDRGIRGETCRLVQQAKGRSLKTYVVGDEKAPGGPERHRGKCVARGGEGIEETDAGETLRR